MRRETASQSETLRTLRPPCWTAIVCNVDHRRSSVPPGLPERIELHRVQTHDNGVVPRRLLDSWQRSEDYGVPLDSVDPVFTGTSDLGSLFHQCGTEVLRDLHRTLA